MKLMRRICWDIDRLTRAYHLLCATESRLNLAFKHSKSFFEVMAMRRRPAIPRYMHVDQAKPARRVFAGKKDCVSISSQPNVGKLLLGVRLREDKVAFKVVGWDRCRALVWHFRFGWHSALVSLLSIGLPHGLASALVVASRA